MGNQRVENRRQSSDRRQSIDRRQKSDSRQVVFEICRSQIHLAIVIFGAGDVSDKLITRSLRWRKEATSLNTESGNKELTDAIREIVIDERLAGARVRIALGGEFCVTRIISGQTDDVQREFAELEERSMRYLTLGPGPKALSSSFQQLDARHQYAMLTVANQKTLDLLMHITEAIGLQLESIEPSLVALSRAQANLRTACEEACLIVQLDESGAELGICHRGRLMLDYRPGGQANADNVADIVAHHLSRLQRYLKHYQGYLDKPLRHVYLTGESDAVIRAYKKFTKLRQFEVHVLNPEELSTPWKNASETDPCIETAAAIGSAMALYPNLGEHHGPNMIEQVLAGQREPMRPVLIRCLAPVAALLLVAVGLLALLVQEKRGTGVLRAELEALSPVRARAAELSLTLSSSEAKLMQLQILEKQLPQPNWQQVLTRITQCLPDDVWLDRLTFRDGSNASLTGASYTDGGVYDFVGNLKQVPDIAEIALEGTGAGQSATGPTTNFDLKLSLADFAGRSGNEGRHD